MKNPIYEAFVSSSTTTESANSFSQLEAWWKQGIAASKGPIQGPAGGIHIEPHEMAYLLLYAGAMAGVTQQEWEGLRKTCIRACAVLKEQDKSSPAMAKIREAFNRATLDEGEKENF